MNNILKLVLLIFLSSEIYAQSSSEKLAQMVAEETNKANASLSSVNNGVKIYKSEAIGNMVVHHRQELTKSKVYLKSIKNKYVNSYQQAGCSFIKPLIREGVIIKSNTYDKNGDLAFSFIVRCN